MRIALFVTCLADTLFPAVGRATVRLLERRGHRVEFNKSAVDQSRDALRQFLISTVDDRQ